MITAKIAREISNTAESKDIGITEAEYQTFLKYIDHSVRVNAKKGHLEICLTKDLPIWKSKSHFKRFCKLATENGYMIIKHKPITGGNKKTISTFLSWGWGIVCH